METKAKPQSDIFSDLQGSHVLIIYRAIILFDIIILRSLTLLSSLFLAYQGSMLGSDPTAFDGSMLYQ
jgi:hypothetical protein